MSTQIAEFMNTFGYLGVAILITIENIFPPIPSEVILTFAGFMTTYTNMNLIGTILSATAGSVFGALLLYWLGFGISQERLEKLLDGKIGHMLHFKKEDVQSAMNWFNDKGNYTVFFCRCIPIVRSLISIPAGLAKMNILRFFILTILGSLVWNILLISLGAAAGASWQKIANYASNYTSSAKLVLSAMVVIGIVWWVKKRKKRT